MRVAAIYDLHANLPALEAVLEDVRRAKVDLVIVGGDVLPGPMPRESLDLLYSLEIPTRFLHGNGESETLALIDGHETGKVPASYREAMRWNADQVRGKHEGLLRGWPAEQRIRIPPLGDVLFCHATPRNDFEIFVATTPEEVLRPIFEATGADVVVCGHTHMQFDRRIGQTRVVNAGSAGMPFAEPGAYWLLLGPDVELRRTKFDLTRAAERIRRTDYPQASEFADQSVLHPPTEREMLALYSKAELR